MIALQFAVTLVDSYIAFFPDLNRGCCECEHLAATKTTTQKNGKNSVVPLASKVRIVSRRE